MSRYPKPKASDMFADAKGSVEIAERYDAFQAELDKSLSTPRPPLGSPNSELAKQLGEKQDFLAKSVDPRTVMSIRNALTNSELNKDWTTTTPLGSGLVAYDLEPAAKLLTPRPTPLRNRIARHRGVGLNHQFKRILGFSGTRTGGAAGAPINPGIDESTTNTFGPGNIAYARGPKIAYAADEKIVPYVQAGLSDEVSFAAQFAGASFEDIRQLSTNSLLYASMLSEESLILGGRGTRSGFTGALAAPTGLSLTVRNAASNEVGNTANIANLFVRVTSVGVWGQSVSSAEATSTGLSAATGKVIDVSLVDAPGSLGYRVYVGTATGAANTYAAAVSNSSASLNVAPLPAGSSVPGAPITISFNGAGTGGAPNAGATAPTSDSTAYTNNYDGILSHCTGSDAGYVKRLNAPFSAAGSPYANNPAGEFEDAFAAMYDAVKADPDEILCSGRDRKSISELLKTQSSSNYQISLINAPGTEGVHDATMGALVTGVQNEITGKMLDLTVHPWLPQGSCPIISWTLPLPDSQVSECFAVFAPQDLVMYQWPVTQYYYEASTYWFSSLISYANPYQGCIQGIFRS